jgi:4-methoxybenzoate monooxygenase (O-demethylating)
VPCSRVLSGPAIKKLRTAFEAEADRLVEELVSRGEFDAVGDLAMVYPPKVMGDAVGVPLEGRECLLPFSNMLFNSFGPENDIFRQSIVESDRVVKQLFAQCERASLSPDGFGAQIYQAAAKAGSVLTRRRRWCVPCCRRASTPRSPALATRSMRLPSIPTSGSWCAKTPPWRAAPLMRSSAGDSPVQTFFRTTSRAIEIDGIRLEADRKVLLFLGAANRDPRQWKNPERLDLRRKTLGHVAFGSGIHVCVGMMVARLEAEALFAAFAKRVKAFELVRAPTRRRNNTLRTLARLPVRAVC